MRTRNLFLLGATAAVGLGLFVIQDVLSHYEEPAYEVVIKEGNFEIRKYPQRITAEVVVPNDSKHPDNDAFRILAGYIFGKNRAKEKIAMTVPVTMEKSAREESTQKIAMTVPVTTETLESGMRMRFFMPSRFTLETLPVPVDNRVQLRTFSPQSFAVIGFSGLLTKKASKEHEARLRKLMREHSYEPKGEALVTAYNPPWTLPFMRRNEVWIPIAL